MNTRIQYIDQIKAFLILLVILGHVYFLGMHTTSMISRFQDIFCMPVFFFVSGLFCKPTYSIRDFVHLIKKKFTQLIIPFLSCSLLYTYLCLGGDWMGLICSEMHNGYWFLLVLFEIYIVYSLIVYISNKISSNNYKLLYSFLILFSLVFLFAGWKKVLPEPYSSICSFFRFGYNFPYFWLGGGVF